MNRTLTLIAMSTLVLGALAVPVMADHNDRHSAAQQEREDRVAAADERGNASSEPAEDRRAAAEDRRAAAMERRDMIRSEIEERRAAFQEAREACLAAFRGSGNDTQNGSAAPGRCISMAAHDHAHKEARAAHYLEHQIQAIEHRLDRLDALEARVQDRIISGDLNETEQAAAEAHLERIDAAQALLEEKLEALKARLAELKGGEPEEADGTESSETESVETESVETESVET